MKTSYSWDEFKDIDWMELMPIFLPIGIIMTLLAAIALIDLFRHRHERDYVLLWTLIIILLSIIGPIVYFIIGRRGAGQR